MEDKKKLNYCKDEYIELIENCGFTITKTYEEYEKIKGELNCPLFKMDVLYNSLKDKVPIDKAPSFEAERKRKKKFEGKVPDPNETWGEFAKRMWNLNLQNPPMVEKDSLTPQQKNTLYMRMQSKLVEMEHGVESKNILIYS